MKTPFRGQFNIQPTSFSEAIKEEFLHNSSPRYIWIALPEPIRQMGQDFSFIVLPVKLRDDLMLEQCGLGVLCQTEDEMKESLELLTRREKGSVVLLQSRGFGTIGKITNFREVITEQSVRYRIGKNGEKQWWAMEREIDKATGEVNVLRRHDAASESEATSVAKGWLQEYQKEKEKHTNASLEAKTLPPPPRCTALTKRELEDDLPAAKWLALKRQWPHSFEIFEKRRANPNSKISDQECQDAYLLDLVEHGYDPRTETIRGDLALLEALVKASKKYARARKRKITDLALYLIAFNWELGWCYLSDAEIAVKLTEIIKMQFSGAQVKQYRLRELGLIAKHLPGPEPKSS